MPRPGLTVFMCVLLFYGTFGGIVLADESFYAAGIQLEISPGLYADEETFSARAAELIE